MVLDDPSDRARELLEEELKLCPGLRAHQLVLRYGRAYRNRENPKGLRRLQAKGKCFGNAIMLVLDSEGGDLARYRGLDVGFYDKSFVYVEGYALSHAGSSLLIHHAWVADRAGNVIDRTWGYDAGRAYFGIPFRVHFARRGFCSMGFQALLGARGDAEGSPPPFSCPVAEWLHE
jgi:hypothetical protein